MVLINSNTNGSKRLSKVHLLVLLSSTRYKDKIINQFQNVNIDEIIQLFYL